MKQSLTTFIINNRDELDEVIKRICPNAPHFNDDTRRQWILNDEGLYNWAQSEGVNV